MPLIVGPDRYNLGQLDFLRACVATTKKVLNPTLLSSTWSTCELQNFGNRCRDKICTEEELD